MPEFAISNSEIQTLAKYIYQISGIDLDEQKGYLIQTRLKPLLISMGLQSYQELYHQARADKTGALEKKIIDSISTQETLFFRDQAPFDLFKYKILPDLIDRKSGSWGKPRISIWSAACSTGQEVYSIAISLLQVLSNIKEFEIDILGTDISEQALAQASYGKFNTFEIERGLPKTILQKYFHPLPDGWRIKDEVRSMVKFQKQNLMQDFSSLGKFDVIFCRNVAIYFAHQDKVRLFSRLARALEPHGYLLLGGSESLNREIAPQYESKRYLRATYYHLRQYQEATPQAKQENKQTQTLAATKKSPEVKVKQPATQNRPAQAQTGSPRKPQGLDSQKQQSQTTKSENKPQTKQSLQNPKRHKRLLDRFSKNESKPELRTGQSKEEKTKSTPGKPLLQRLTENKKSRKK